MIDTSQIHVDRPEDIWPDSMDLTAVRLRTLAKGVWEYGHAHGHLPTDLARLMQADSTGNAFGSRDAIDAWSRPFRYRVRNRQFELRSGGRDGLFDNADDIVVADSLKIASPPV